MADAAREQAPEQLPWFIADEPISPNNIAVTAIDGAGPLMYGTNGGNFAASSADLTLAIFRHFAIVAEVPEGPLPQRSDVLAYYQLARLINRGSIALEGWAQVCRVVLPPLEARSPIIIGDTLARRKQIYQTPGYAKVMTRLAVAEGLGAMPSDYAQKVERLKAAPRVRKRTELGSFGGRGREAYG